MAKIPILPSFSIFIGLLLLEYIIYDSYIKSKKENFSKQYVGHEQTGLLELDGLPLMMTLPPIEPLTMTPQPQYIQQENFQVPPQVSAPLPIPKTGLPEGWTIEQWNYYGAQWLESRNL